MGGYVSRSYWIQRLYVDDGGDHHVSHNVTNNATTSSRQRKRAGRHVVKIAAFYLVQYLKILLPRAH